MKAQRDIVWVAALVLLSCGCVERKLLIRSDPPGAPVWVDEKFVGVTSDEGVIEYPFSHYGRRRVRAGPIRNESNQLQYLATERELEIEAPWYETCPIDFFFEVIFPWTLVDEHEIEMRLTAADQHPRAFEEGAAKRVLKEAEEFRDKALKTIPEGEE